MKRAARDALTFIASFGAKPARPSSGALMDPVPPAAIANDPNLSLLWQRQEFLARQQTELLGRVTALERRGSSPVVKA